jgi:hypothetical protein
MPRNPSPAQREASRRNGARSHGPTSAEGRARIARAATRHGLTGTFRLLPGEDARAFAALRAAWIARLRPEGAVEEAAVDKIVAAIWREQRLVGVEDRLLSALARGEPVDGLPSLATVIRYRNRLERDRRLAEDELERLRGLRPVTSVEADAPAADPGKSGADEPRSARANGATRGAGTEPAVGASTDARPSGASGPVTGRPARPFGADPELARLLHEAERALAKQARTGAAANADPLAALGTGAAPRGWRTSASAAAIVATAA